MPKDPSIRRVLVLGSGPIVIGQAAEFDYAGTQACLALREESVEVVLVNSNPATIQTDATTADRVYIEPLTVESVRAVLTIERHAGRPVDGLLASCGGQTALNLAVALERAGVLSDFRIRVLGTSIKSIRMAEDRQTFADLMHDTGQPVLEHTSVSDVWAAREFAVRRGLPLIVRAPFSLGGAGSGYAHTLDQLDVLVTEGLKQGSLHGRGGAIPGTETGAGTGAKDISMEAPGTVLVERSVLGWGEIEYEIVRDRAGNAICVCNMENIDPMGVHTGESVVVAPSQTLSDGDYQNLRSAALHIVGSLDVRGACNCQLAFNYSTGEYAVIEVNPRLSRSSALASKATGYPIARIAAKLALGYTLPELCNDITGASAGHEPALDYVVVKIPRWPFDKFPLQDRTLGMRMKSTGEVMAIGRSFEEALAKAVRSIDGGGARSLWEYAGPLSTSERRDAASLRALAQATPDRLQRIMAALRAGHTPADIAASSNIHQWFVERMQHMARAGLDILRLGGLGTGPSQCGWPANQLDGEGLESVRVIKAAKYAGMPDQDVADLLNAAYTHAASTRRAVGPGQQWRVWSEQRVRETRERAGIQPVYKMVDTCAGEFEAYTPYFYSTYEPSSGDYGYNSPGDTDGLHELGRLGEQGEKHGEGQGWEQGWEQVTGGGSNEAVPLAGPKAIVLGSGPIRIGQGIEFDYSAVHVVYALRAAGYGAIVINNNPETVSTDYSLSSRRTSMG